MDNSIKLNALSVLKSSIKGKHLGSFSVDINFIKSVSKFGLGKIDLVLFVELIYDPFYRLSAIIYDKLC